MKIELLPNRVQVHVRCWIDPDARRVIDSYREATLLVDKTGHCDVRNPERASVREALDILQDEGMLRMKQVSMDGDQEYFLTRQGLEHFDDVLDGLTGWHSYA